MYVENAFDDGKKITTTAMMIKKESKQTMEKRNKRLMKLIDCEREKKMVKIKFQLQCYFILLITASLC